MNTVLGVIEEKKEGWFFSLGNHTDKSVKNESPMPDLETCFNKMLEHKINPEARLIPLISIKGGLISYDLYNKIF